MVSPTTYLAPLTGWADDRKQTTVSGGSLAVDWSWSCSPWPRGPWRCVVGPWRAETLYSRFAAHPSPWGPGTACARLRRHHSAYRLLPWISCACLERWHVKYHCKYQMSFVALASKTYSRAKFLMIWLQQITCNLSMFNLYKILGANTKFCKENLHTLDMHTPVVKFKSR